MQPHSMCTLALTNYLWNDPYHINISSCEMKVEYRSIDGRHKTMYYTLMDIVQSKDRREITSRIKRHSGGFSCTMTADRNSIQEGSEITMRHSVIHIHGLKETFNLWKKNTSNGRHHNSKRYAGFKGEQRGPDRKQYDLNCEILADTGEWLTSKYELEIESVYLK